MTFYENENDSSQHSVSLLPQNDFQQEQTHDDQSLTDISGISEQVAPEKGNLSKNDEFQDRFENIFYTVTNNKDNGRLSIVFATKELYSAFLLNFQKGFQPQEPVNGMRTYNFHVHKQKCIVTCHEEESGITAKGQGCKIWRQTGFMTLATKIYCQYVMEMNKLLGINEQPTPLPVPAASTPNINRHIDGVPWSPALTNQPTENAFSEVLRSQTEIKSQTASLMEIVINIQEQIQQLNPKHCEQSQIQHDAEDTEDPLNSTTADTVHTDTTEENTHQAAVIAAGSMRHNEAVQSTHATQNIAPRQGSVQTHEAQSNHNEQSSRQNGGPGNPGEPNRTNVQTHQTQNKTLLIGDSILSGVNRKGLKNNVHCAPFPGATIDIISKNISMYDLTQFKNVVIYCGGNDSAKPNNVENFRKGYDTLLKFIKNKNPECMVYLCSSCPRGDTDTTDVNKVIKTMTVAHGGSYVDAYSAFYDNNNDLRTKFYKPRDWIHLSHSGIKRLLGTINLVLPIVDNFKFCVYQQVSENKPEMANLHKVRNPRNQGRRQREQPNRRETDINHYSTAHSGRSKYSPQFNRDTTSSYGGQNGFTNSYPENNNDHYQYRSESQYTYHNGQHCDINENYGLHYDRNENYQQHYDRNDNYQQHYDRNVNYPNRYEEQCMKCGLTNHTTSDCHHKRQLLCYVCNYYGHKDSICWNK